MLSKNSGVSSLLSVLLSGFWSRSNQSSLAPNTKSHPFPFLLLTLFVTGNNFYPLLLNLGSIHVNFFYTSPSTFHRQLILPLNFFHFPLISHNTCFFYKHHHQQQTKVHWWLVCEKSEIFCIVICRVCEMSDAPPSPTHESGGEQSPRGSSSGAREQDRYLPIANISRIMKKALPPNGKIAKDAKDTMQECVSEFISFITSESVSNYTYPYQMFCFYLAQNVFFFLMDDCSFLFLFFGD